MLLVVVGEHLELRARLVDQPLFGVQLGERLVHLEQGRIELDDLLVDRDRFDEETFLGVALRDLGEEIDRLVDALDPRVEVADPVQRVDVVRVVGEQLAILADRRLDFAARNVLLCGLYDLVTRDSHQRIPSKAIWAGNDAGGIEPVFSASTISGLTLRNVSRWTGDGPSRSSAATCSGTP